MWIETKFNYNEEAWYMEGNKPKMINVTELKIEFTYKGNGGAWAPGVTSGQYVAYPQEEWYKENRSSSDWIPATKLYKSKAELVAELMDVNLYL